MSAPHGNYEQPHRHPQRHPYPQPHAYPPPDPPAAQPHQGPARARPFASFRLRADVRLFNTNQHLACRQDPELFFDARRRHRAIKRCTDCPFRGRCGYNAVATGATHGVWGGVILPGDYPQELKPLYAFLTAQFEQRRHAEIGDVAVAPLPELSDDQTDDDEPDDDEPPIFHAGVRASRCRCPTAGRPRPHPPRSHTGFA